MQGALIGGREAVPTLAELFDEFPDARFNIDIKSPARVRPLADFIATRGAHDRVLVGSFSAPGCASSAGSPGAGSPPARTRRELVGVPAVPSARLADRLTRGRPAAPADPAPDPRQVAVGHRGLVRRAHAAGKHVHVWTIDDPDEMQVLLDLGVDGLMTDRTDILRDVLDERGQWREEA